MANSSKTAIKLHFTRKINLHSFKSQTFCKQKRIEETVTVNKEVKQKRALGDKKRCKIALVADHRFYKEIGNSNAQLTTINMVNMSFCFK